jgi:hypothetical protein
METTKTQDRDELDSLRELVKELQSEIDRKTQKIFALEELVATLRGDKECSTQRQPLAD